MNFTVKQLNEICDIKIGRTPPRKERQWFNTGGDDWKWVSIKDMGECGHYINFSSETISRDGQIKFNIPIVSRGTIILSFKLTVGRLAICGDDMITNEAIAQLPIKDKSIVDRDYLYYFLKYFDYSKLGSTSSIATAVNSKMVGTIPIALPDIVTQKRIASHLIAIDLKIDNNTHTNDNLYKIAIATFNNDFNGRIRGTHKIGDFMVPKRGKALLSKDARPGAIPVVAGGLGAATYHDAANTKSPVVTISASGANAGFVKMWNLPVWSSDSSFIDETISPYVYFWYVMLKSRQKEIYDSQTGSAQAHIYPKHIAEMPIGDILEKEMADYSAKTSSIFTKIGENSRENAHLTRLRDTLLPELMNGKIDLSKVEI